MKMARRNNGDERMATMAATAAPRMTRSATKSARSRAWADDDSNCGDGFAAEANGTPVLSRAASLQGTDVPAPHGAAPDGAAPDGAALDNAPGANALT